jgi:ubiquinone/menaquinone biosynthesis C-methylase UbiE
MDPTTQAVRAMYERYPYPSVANPEMRVGSNVRLLLSYGRLPRSGQRPLQCLEAGCGRGNGALGAAATQPDVQFTAIDINRVALADAEKKAGELGLRNIRFQDVDLMTLDGLEVPEGGFDAIISSGVLHHLTSPDEGLARLRRVLAPHGVISLMVYGTHGREPLYRLVRALEILVPRERPIEERLAVARRLVKETSSDAALRVGPIELTDTIPDNEFVDRYLNVNETSYDLESLWALLARHDLRFIRWLEPEEWGLSRQASATATLTQHLTDLERYQLVEQITWRHKLSMVVGTTDNGPRELPPTSEWAALTFAVNPEVSIEIQTRNLKGSQRVEQVAYRLRAMPAVVLSGLTASVVLALRDQTTTFQGHEVITSLGIDRALAIGILSELVQREILFSPSA